MRKPTLKKWHIEVECACGLIDVFELEEYITLKNLKELHFKRKKDKKTGEYIFVKDRKYDTCTCNDLPF